MPKNCVVFGCANHNWKQGKQRSYFVLPKRAKSPQRRDKWLAALHRENEDGSHWSPPKSRVVCSDHFVSGRPVKNPMHPDYAPSILPHLPQSGKKASHRMESYERHQLTTSKRESAAENSKSTKKHCGKRLPFSDPTERTNECENIEPATINVNMLTELLREESTQTEPDQRQQLIQQLNSEIQALRQDLYDARDKIDELENKVEGVRLSASAMKGNDTRCKFYTGLPWDTFMRTYYFLAPHVRGKTKDSLPFIDQFFLTLVRLRLDLSFELLAYQTGRGETTIRTYFWKWLDVMYAKLGFLIQWPDRKSILETLPPEFRQKFPRMTSIIDCFEIFIESPGSLSARQQTYSNYKKHTTAKVLIASSCLGAITFLSLAWGGRVSDVELVRRSGFISPTLHHPGDQILADRGFTLEDDFATVCAAELVIPAFRCDGLTLACRMVTDEHVLRCLTV
ncbi:tRNA methyltransferase 10 homolog B isoform X1 [Nerophis lumbriciformis]|uniref:tRNA methyltransferase 10 homolog B isoform X1 n=1 Tax=Nerophis lumbriciformis TaxID=546530 RepID=UPI002ADF4C81|nr:uncharacterized protein LOC133606519 [Nerophis lumbriciformis]